MTTISQKLGRTFFDLPSDEQHDVETSEFLARFSRGRSIDWPALLQSDRILIVSEAGMGKSYECRREQKRLWLGGEAAFFIELADLATGPFENSLSPQELSRFHGWKSAQTERATFFLDSVDELQLTRTSFASALKSFARSLGDNLGRVCIVLTTRPIPVDREIARAILPIPRRVELSDPEEEFAEIAMRTRKEVEEPSSDGWRFVALASLNESQMQAIAAERGIADISGLLEEISARNAHDFAKRPLDFIDLCSDWRDHGRIRAHRHQLDHSIEVKLRPRADRLERDEVNPVRAREGAARLALAALLTRKLTLWHGRDDDRSENKNALDPARILTDWTQGEIQTLLERSLFGFANYGRVRFHHRSAIDFLAAERLAVLRSRGLTDRAIKGLLFSVGVDTERLIKPTMAAVAAWLAHDIPFVCEEVMKHEPSLLLNEGDPESLALAIRENALKRYVENYGKGGWRGQPVPSLQVQRFASKDLSSLISALWKTGVENPEVRETLLALIGAARIQSNADIAYQAAIDPGGETRDRLNGLKALSQVGDARLGALLDQIAASDSVWPTSIAHGAIVHLFPRHMSIKQLLGNLTRLKPNKRGSGGLVGHLSALIERADFSIEQVVDLRQGLAEMLARNLQWDSRLHRIVSGRRDLSPALLSACVRELQFGRPGNGIAEAVAMGGILAKNDHRSDDELRELCIQLDVATDSLRAEVFWKFDDLMLGYHPRDERSASSRLFSFYDLGPYRIDPTRDGEWILDAVASSALPIAKRELALEVAIEFARSDAEKDNWIAKLEAAVIGGSELRKRFDFFRESILNSPAVPTWAIESAKRQEKARRKQAAAFESWKRFHREIKLDPDTAFSRANVKNTVWNFWQAMEREQEGVSGPGWNRRFIERMFNRETADRFRSAFSQTWRGDIPTVKSEREEDKKNVYYVRWTLGLSGIYAEAEDPSWTDKLSEDEARLACRYALLSLNQLPPWIDALIDSHPVAVDDVIGNELSDELQSKDESYSMLLQEVRRANPAVALFFLPRVRSWVHGLLTQQTSQLAGEALKRGIEYVLEFGESHDFSFIRATALSILSRDISQKSLLLWIPILGRLDALAAVEVLENVSKAVTPAKDSEIVRLIGAFFGHHASLGLSAFADEPELLLRLLRIANLHVRPQDDEVHGDAYSPGLRDDAEYARSRLFSSLMEAKGPLALKLKLELAEDHNATRYRDRVIAIAREKLAAELDTFSLDEAEVVRFERDFEFAPKSRREMAALLESRLDDIDDLLLQDGSPRELWSTIKLERHLRRDLCRELTHLSRNGYISVQEAVTADENETDIRLISKAASLEAVIELKIGENDYTTEDFRFALNDQLVRKYMAPEQRRVGVLLISWNGAKTWKDPATGKKVKFNEMIRVLNDEAKALQVTLGHDAFLSVRGLYLGLNRVESA